MFPVRPLTDLERKKLHPNERLVVDHYERVTRRSFMRDELIVLKEVIRAATPAQINKSISLLYRQYPDRFLAFEYIQPYVERVFKNRRKGGRSHGQ